jgi:CII-binding regulator of phage lambda lysogenization HflD
MIKNIAKWEEFERKLDSETNTSYAEKLRIFDSMFELRKKLYTDYDIMEGLSEKIEFHRRFKNAWRAIKENSQKAE